MNDTKIIEQFNYFSIQIGYLTKKIAKIDKKLDTHINTFGLHQGGIR